ncbi:MAG: hypothetical protein KJ718_05385 [Nanoarchaeota archaeon]|nr:hypothetical protein [Nanoarchaeota archaeon]MBU1051955.1 hypothetical protein [Nanoarchaeota archaeon]MBU1988295.1 hypothetical protein [Nanoarchaeota archaeon]
MAKKAKLIRCSQDVLDLRKGDFVNIHQEPEGQTEVYAVLDRNVYAYILARPLKTRGDAVQIIRDRLSFMPVLSDGSLSVPERRIVTMGKESEHIIYEETRGYFQQLNKIRNKTLTTLQQLSNQQPPSPPSSSSLLSTLPIS